MPNSLNDASMKDATNAPTGISRRAVSSAAAWTVPAVAIAAGAPLAAASPTVGKVIITAANNNTVTGPGRKFADLTVRLYESDGVTPVPTSTAVITVQLPTGYSWGDGGTQPTRPFTAVGGQFVLTGDNAIVAKAGPVTSEIIAATAVDASPAAGAPSSFTEGTLGLSTVLQPGGNGTGAGFKLWGRDNYTGPQWSTGYTTSIASNGVVLYPSTMNEAIPFIDYAGFGLGDGYLITTLNQLIDNTGGGWMFDSPYGGADAVVATPSGLQADEKMIRVTSTQNSGAVLTTHGRVLTWASDGQAGDLADGAFAMERSQPAPVTTFPEGTVITKLTSSLHRYYAIDFQGQLWTWGWSGDYADGSALGNGNAVSGNSATPTRVVTAADGSSILTGVTDVQGMVNGGAALVGGKVYTWGSGVGNVLADGSSATPRNYAAPVLTSSGELTGIVTLGKTGQATNYLGGTNNAGVVAAINAAGQLYTWGATATLTNSAAPSGVYAAIDPIWAASGIGPAKDVFSGQSSISVVAHDGTAWSWGSNGEAQFGNGSGQLAGGFTYTPTMVVNSNGTPFTASGFDDASTWMGRVVG